MQRQSFEMCLAPGELLIGTLEVITTIAAFNAEAYYMVDDELSVQFVRSLIRTVRFVSI